MTQDEVKLITALWKRGWLNEKGLEAFNKECRRVIFCFATVDEAYNTANDVADPEFELIPEIETIKVTLHKDYNCDYIRYIPAKSLSFYDEQLTNKGLGRETCFALLKEGNKTGMEWAFEQNKNK